MGKPYELTYSVKLEIVRMLKLFLSLISDYFGLLKDSQFHILSGFIILTQGGFDDEVQICTLENSFNIYFL